MRPIAIIGPTGTGKSALALAVAERLSGEIGVEIVNADAMQLYRGMDIGTAKLAPAERRGIPHHQLDVLEVTETATVARYQQAAADDIEAIAARGAVPIVVGGSMMYIQSLLDEWAFPATDPAVRAKWEQRLAEVGVGGLHEELARIDAAAASSILPTDGRRIVRALEVVELTGQPFAASAPAIGAPRWDTAIVGLDWDTALLDERLAKRTDKMFAEGLVDEVTTLLDRGLRDGVTASRALGYAQVIAALDEGGGAEALADRARAHIHRHPPLRAPAAVLVPPRPPHSLARRRRLQATSRTRCGCGGTYPDQVKFAKGHGTQNDFVLLPDPQARLTLSPAAVAALCDRRRGLGADGVLRVTTAEAAQAAGVFDRLPEGVVAGDWYMDYRNADGSIAQMCGNGVRVFAHYLRASRTGDPRRVRRRLPGRSAPGGAARRQRARRHDADVTVEMGKTNQLGTGEAIVGGRPFAGLAIDVGNPHLACVDADLTAERAGRARCRRAGLVRPRRSSPTASTWKS